MTEPCEHCCHEPTFKAAERQKQPYMGLWQSIVARAHEMSPDVPIYKRDLDRWIAEIWEAQPDAKAAFALNTTLYGREGESA